MDGRAHLLERFHVALVASIERTRPSYLTEPFTIGEIYETLIPYRTHRDLIGVAMNGDYEDGLMRLLSGEGGYLQVEPPEIAQVLAEELERKHPDTGRFKEFTDATVRLNPELLSREPPKTPSGGVAKLFGGDAEPARRSGGTRNGWDLDDRGRGEAPSGDRGTESTGGGQPVEARRPASHDRVHTAREFWAEREQADEEEPATAASGSNPGGATSETERLEAENRRLKILLAERVLEVEELRERLNRGTGARRETP